MRAGYARQIIDVEVALFQGPQYATVRAVLDPLWVKLKYAPLHPSFLEQLLQNIKFLASAEVEFTAIWKDDIRFLLVRTLVSSLCSALRFPAAHDLLRRGRGADGRFQ